jgi:tRNA-2-methylthio-N6-dimethylallyladenosine synthase
MDTLLQDKTHDESRQGEALLLGPTGKNNGRKLYIELRLCDEFFRQ